MKIQVTIDIPDDQFDKLWRIASNRVYTYQREDPRKAWTTYEKKQVIRLYLQQLADSAVVRHDDDETRGD